MSYQILDFSPPPSIAAGSLPLESVMLLPQIGGQHWNFSLSENSLSLVVMYSLFSALVLTGSDVPVDKSALLEAQLAHPYAAHELLPRTLQIGQWAPLLGSQRPVPCPLDACLIDSFCFASHLLTSLHASAIIPRPLSTPIAAHVITF